MPSMAPRAKPLRRRSRRISTGPTVAPKMPVIATKLAVMPGTPPISCEAIMAKGVVTERGKRLSSMTGEKCSRCASAAETTTDSTLPARTPAIRTGQ